MIRKTTILSITLITILSITLSITPAQNNLALADTIYLKNGRIIQTDGFWDEGDQIKYTKYGATIGLNKDKILKIERDSWADRGQRCIEERKYKEALEYFTIAIEKEPGNIKNYISRANCWRGLNSLDNEYNDLKAALRLDPYNESIRSKIVALEKKQSKRKKLQQSIQKSTYSRGSTSSHTQRKTGNSWNDQEVKKLQRFRDSQITNMNMQLRLLQNRIDDKEDRANAAQRMNQHREAARFLRERNELIRNYQQMERSFREAIRGTERQIANRMRN